jgi:hypothetical protein
VSQTFLVAPWIEERSIRDWFETPELVELLRRYGLTPASVLQTFLGAMEAGGVREGVDLGYTLSVALYDLFSRSTGSDWEYDEAKLDFFLDFIRDVGRPVVLNLRANHFVGESDLAQELAHDYTGLARTNDRLPVREAYFNNTTFAPVFSLDENIRLNRFRFGGFRRAAEQLAKFDRSHRGLLRAVTLAGELHHYFSNLADSTSAGQFGGIQTTDYSESSVRDFREWLRQRYVDLGRMNGDLGTSFAGWDAVVPPAVDLRTQPDAPSWMHMDSYCNGRLPIFGWAELQEGDRIEVYVDGKLAGHAAGRFSRMDVYDSLADMARSDVGWRLELDYRQLSPGPHIVHVVVQWTDGPRFLVNSREIWICSRSFTERGNVDAAYPELDCLPRASAAYMDHPPNGLALLFNPFGAEWQTFRELQVSNLLGNFARIAAESGLDPDRIFSHQITPQLEGSWNQVAFAVDAGEFADPRYLPGVNLYGGTVTYPRLAELTKGRPYGVPEFHPRMGKPGSKSVFRSALDFHLKNGAVFVCPYFMSMRHPQLSAVRNDVLDMLIHPLNPALGSHFFYSAVADFLRRA